LHLQQEHSTTVHGYIYSEKYQNGHGYS